MFFAKPMCERTLSQNLASYVLSEIQKLATIFQDDIGFFHRKVRQNAKAPRQKRQITSAPV
jgi:hypothetical protein